MSDRGASDWLDQEREKREYPVVFGRIEQRGLGGHFGSGRSGEAGADEVFLDGFEDTVGDHLL